MDSYMPEPSMSHQDSAATLVRDCESGSASPCSSIVNLADDIKNGYLPNSRSRKHSGYLDPPGLPFQTFHALKDVTEVKESPGTSGFGSEGTGKDNLGYDDTMDDDVREASDLVSKQAHFGDDVVDGDNDTEDTPSGVTPQ